MTAIIENVLMCLGILVVLNVVVLSIWIGYVSVRDRRRVARGELLIATYSFNDDEEAAIIRAKEILSQGR